MTSFRSTLRVPSNREALYKHHSLHIVSDLSYLVKLRSKLATILFILSNGLPPSFTAPLPPPRSVTALPDLTETAFATF